jgi:hypothetical protein
MLRPRTLVLIGMIFTAVLSRLLPHPRNMASFAAVALFGGAYFADWRLVFLVPLSALFFSDLILGFYRGIEVVYLSFAAVVCIGTWLRRHRSALPIVGAALAGSALFFLVTNFDVWAFGSLYPKTPEGLLACYVAAIPFFGNTLQGVLLYTVILFGGFALLERRFDGLRQPSAISGARRAH